MLKKRVNKPERASIDKIYGYWLHAEESCNKWRRKAKQGDERAAEMINYAERFRELMYKEISIRAGSISISAITELIDNGKPFVILDKHSFYLHVKI